MVRCLANKADQSLVFHHNRHVQTFGWDWVPGSCFASQLCLHFARQGLIRTDYSLKAASKCDIKFFPTYLHLSTTIHTLRAGPGGGLVVFQKEVAYNRSESNQRDSLRIQQGTGIVGHFALSTLYAIGVWLSANYTAGGLNMLTPALATIYIFWVKFIINEKITQIMHLFAC